MPQLFLEFRRVAPAGVIHTTNLSSPVLTLIRPWLSFWQIPQKIPPYIF